MKPQFPWEPAYQAGFQPEQVLASSPTLLAMHTRHWYKIEAVGILDFISALSCSTASLLGYVVEVVLLPGS